jgi:hypothetical protein
MKPLASAGFNGRLIPRMAPQAPDRAASAAEVTDLRASAAFSHFTETCGNAPTSQQAATAPEHATHPSSGAVSISNPLAGAATSSSGQIAPADLSGASAVALSEASRFILSLIAAHEGRSERDILAELIAAAGHAIGLSSLLAQGSHDIGDIADLPGYARRAANRFRSGGP